MRREPRERPAIAAIDEHVEVGAEGLHEVSEGVWEIPASARSDMLVPARVFADRELLEGIRADRSLEQLQNVATLPGVAEAALAMPDVHQGYGFPVGGVAATETPDGAPSRSTKPSSAGSAPRWCTRSRAPSRPGWEGEGGWRCAARSSTRC